MPVSLPSGQSMSLGEAVVSGAPWGRSRPRGPAVSPGQAHICSCGSWTETERHRPPSLCFCKTGPKQDRARQSRAELDRARQSGTGWDRAGQSGTEWDRTRQSQAEPGKAGQSGTEQDRARQSWAEWDREGQSGTERDRAGQSRAEPDGVRFRGLATSSFLSSGPRGGPGKV